MTTQRKISRRHNAAVIRVKKYIDEHPLEGKSTDELAAIGGLGRNALQAGFQLLFGTGVKEYCTMQKMIEAIKLLEDGELVQKVAQACGYRSHSSFSSAFKKLMGKTPNEWKNETE